MDGVRNIQFGVLGPLRAEVAGQVVGLGGPRQRAVLAVLLLARGRIVAAERIVSDVWESSRLPSPTTLHAYVSELRRALEPERAARAPARLLVREGPGYALRVAPAAVDAERFTDLAARGRRALEGGEPEHAEGLLDQALALWRGRAYADFAEADFAVPEAARLEDLRAAVHEDRLAAMIELGQHGAAVGALEALIAEQPLRERGWELLTLALYRSGRQADALAALRAVRRRLADELGIDPGHGLRELETRILAQDPRLAPAPARPRPASAASSPSPQVAAPASQAAAPAPHTSNLPFALSSFVGRGTDLARVGSLLADHRLVTLTGPGGVGKTRLALESARARTDTDGPWLVELAGLHAPELLIATVAAALGVPAAAASPDHLAAVLNGRELLLVLDNCEHLLAPAAALAHTLLSRCGTLRMLATSREPLGIEGEAVYEVPPLEAATDAAELFRRRATAALPNWASGPHDQTRIAALCAGLDGIPLAIELAAAQCRTLSVDQIADALGDRFTLLVSSSAGRPARHRTLQDTVAWGDQLLQPAERRLFHRLGVLAGGFDLEAAAAVGSVTPVLAPLSALVRKSMVTAELGTAPRRYRMLETLREYAQGALAPDDLALAQERHRTWALNRAEYAERHIRGPQGMALLAQLSGDQPQFRAAFASSLAAGDGDYALRLGGALFWFWFRMGHVAEGLTWLFKAFAAAPEADPGTRARARLAAASLCYLAGLTTQAYEEAHTAAQEAREAGDLVTEASASSHAAYMSVLTGVPIDAPALARTAVELARRSAQDWLTAETLMLQGMMLRVLGDLPGAETILQEAIATAHTSGHDWVSDGAAWCAMKTASDRGDGTRALAIAGDILARMDRYGDVSFWLVTVHSTARALALTGRAEQAAVLIGAVHAIGEQAGVSPELMDPLDGPREAAAVRVALPPHEYDRHVARGRTLSRHEAGVLLDGFLSGR